MNGNFKITKDLYLGSIQSHLYLYEHKKTGAEVLFMKNKDKNKSFCIGFMTIEDDKTGLAHIIEHSVLAGSKKYPLRDPFFEAIKSSVNTYMNAWTFPDRTIYPFASQNTQDFYNLQDIYLDAVFNPLLLERVLRREGYREDLLQESDDLKPGGIVYNEMQSSSESIDSLIEDFVIESMFSENVYANGGDPYLMHKITYEKFKKFHALNYHPSNSKTIIYGDIDIKKNLENLDKYFSSYEKLTDIKTIKVQDNIEKRDLVKEFSVNKEGAKAHYVKAIGVPYNLSEKDAVALEMLHYAMVVSDASLFKKELLNSGVGESVITYGFENELHQILIYFGLKKVKAENLDKARDLIQKELKKFEENLSKDQIIGAFNKLKFSKKDLDVNQGITYTREVFSRWLYNKDFDSYLDYDKTFDELHHELENNFDYFRNLFSKYVLNNKHSVDIKFVPVKGLNDKKKLEEYKRLKDKKEALSQEEKQEIIKQTRKLHQWLEQHDTEEVKSKIPKLKVNDLDKKTPYIDFSVERIKDCPIIKVDTDTNGIGVYNFAFDISSFDENLLNYLGLYSDLILDVGTVEMNYLENATRIDNYIGRLNSTVSSVLSVDNECISTVNFKLNTLSENTEKSLDIFYDILEKVSFENKTRVKELIQEEKVSYQSSLLSSPHSYAMYRGLSKKLKTAFVRDETRGISYYQFLKDVLDNFDEQFDIIKEELYKIHNLLKTQNVYIAWADSSIADNNNPYIKERYLNWNKDFIRSQEFKERAKKEAIYTEATVNSNARALSLSDISLRGQILVFAKILSREYLYEQLRVKNGAYGAFCNPYIIAKVVGYSTLADPNVNETYEVYKNAPNYLIDNINQINLDNFILSTIGELDSPLTPSGKAGTVLNRYLQRIDEDYLQHIRDEVFSASKEQLKEFAQKLKEAEVQSKVQVMLGNKTKIKEAIKDQEGFEEFTV